MKNTPKLLVVDLQCLSLGFHFPHNRKMWDVVVLGAVRRFCVIAVSGCVDDAAHKVGAKTHSNTCAYARNVDHGHLARSHVAICKPHDLCLANREHELETVDRL